MDGYCDEHLLYIAQMAWIYSLGDDFDFWSFDLCDWVQLERPSQAIHLERDYDTCLIRVRGVVCHRFGTTLSCVEASSTTNTSRVPLAEAVGDAIPGFLWTLLWTEVTSPSLSVNGSKLTCHSRIMRPPKYSASPFSRPTF